MACILQSIRFSHHFDSDVHSLDLPIDFISPARASKLKLTVCRYRDKLAKVWCGGRRDQYRMYLITTLLPGPADEPLINRVLPKELLLRIFSFMDIVTLCRCAQTCRHWNMLALDGSNWQKVDLFEFQKDIKAPVIENLAKRCGGFLKKLSLRGCESVQDGALRLFADKCHYIEQLNLNKCKRITDSTCESLGKNCHRLVSLDLDGCPAVTEKGLKHIGDGCPNLEHLNISWCENILDNGLEALAAGCAQLKSLICKGCDGLSDNGIIHIAAKCQNLRKIDVHSCFQLTDRSVEAIANGCPRLEHIGLAMCSQMTDRSLHALSNGCPMLKDLEVAGCTLLSDAGFTMLAKNCHELERMDLEDCSLITDHTIEHLATGCPNLINLSLSHCEVVSDVGIRHLAMSLSLHDRLEVLELDNCPLISDNSLENLRQVRTLKRVELFDCQLITKEGIRRFKQHLPQVEVHAYFAPATPPPPSQPRRHGFCRCCAIL